ncbi:MAG: hypothetical protein ACOYMA_09250 [Bacteroidia bacterium]
MEDKNNNVPPAPKKGNGNDERIRARLGKIKLALDNAILPDVQAVIAKNGYDNAEIKVGMNMHDDAYKKHELQKKEYGEQFEATDEFNIAKELANKEYKKHLNIARVVFRNNRKVIETLMLDGLRQKNYDGWYEQLRVFYKNALDSVDIITILTKKGVGKTDLENGWNLTENASTAHAKQSNETSEAVNATKQRDKALDILEEWFSDFSGICHAEMEDYPELIKKLGL